MCYPEFPFTTVRSFYDLVYGIDCNELSIKTIAELAVFVNFEGQLESGSEFEEQLYNDICEILEHVGLNYREIAFLWLYFRTWNLHAAQILSETKLWPIEWDHLYTVISILMLNFDRAPEMSKKLRENTRNMGENEKILMEMLGERLMESGVNILSLSLIHI